MAKNTQHKALASLGQKLKACQKKYNDLRGWYEQSRKDVEHLQGSIQQQNATVAFLKGQRDSAQDKLTELRQDLASSHLVSARQHQQVADELRYANEQVTNLQNRNAALRNKVESAVQGGIIYGALVAIAAYAAGIATQHWFPIAF